jgi:hypothetical protein
MRIVVRIKRSIEMHNRLKYINIIFIILSLPLLSSTIKSNNLNNNIFEVKCSVDVYLDNFKININDTLLNNLFNRFEHQSNLLRFQINNSNNKKVSISLNYGFISLNDYKISSINDTINSFREYLRSISNNISRFNKFIEFNYLPIALVDFNPHDLSKIDSLNIPVKFVIEFSKNIEYLKCDELLINLLDKIDLINQLSLLSYNFNGVGIQTILMFTFNNKINFRQWYKSTQTIDFINWLQSLETDKDSLKQVLTINFDKLLQH